MRPYRTSWLSSSFRVSQARAKKKRNVPERHSWQSHHHVVLAWLGPKNSQRLRTPFLAISSLFRLSLARTETIVTYQNAIPGNHIAWPRPRNTCRTRGTCGTSVACGTCGTCDIYGTSVACGTCRLGDLWGENRRPLKTKICYVKRCRQRQTIGVPNSAAAGYSSPAPPKRAKTARLLTANAGPFDASSWPRITIAVAPFIGDSACSRAWRCP